MTVSIVIMSKYWLMTYPAANCEVSAEQDNRIMPPHPALSLKGAREYGYPAASHRESIDLK
jgi:hypothetical protein